MKKNVRSKLFIFAVAWVCLFVSNQTIFTQNQPMQDYVIPEVSITAPKANSKHNYFPIISGTAEDKSYNGSLASGIAEVRVAIFADNQIWDGREWVNGTGSFDDYKLPVSLSGKNWELSNYLPKKLKQSLNNPQKKITTYRISVMAKDGAGLPNFTYLYITVEPLRFVVVDANKNFSGVDFSNGKTSLLSNNEFERFIKYFPDNRTSNFPAFTNTQNPEAIAQQTQQIIAAMMKDLPPVRIGAVADGTTKLLVVARGHNEGSVNFQSSPNSIHSEACNKNPLAGFDYSSIKIPDVFGGKGEELSPPTPVPTQNYQDNIASSIEKIKSRFENFKVCTTGAKIEQDNFLYLGEYQKSENDYYWFGLYTVPAFISREIDNSMLGQMISLTATITAPNKSINYTPNEQYTSETPFYLRRPPVLLVHGLNDKSESWDLDNNTVLQDKGFDVRLVDYRNTNGESFETNRLVLLGRQKGYLPQGRGETEIGNYGIRDILKEFRQMGFAISKVDVVGHSMGGNLARVFYQQPEYRNDDNFQEGYIRRLITIGTPHLGSNIANIINNDIANRGNLSCGKVALLGIAFEQGTFSLSDEANIDLAINSEALSKIGRTKIPSHAIFAISNVLRGSYLDRYNKVDKCPYQLKGLRTIRDNNEPDPHKNFIKSSCAGAPCDLVVSIHSQIGGLVEKNAVSYIKDTNHGEEIRSVEIRERVSNLLFGGLESFQLDGFPAVKSIDPPLISLDTYPEIFAQKGKSAVKLSSKKNSKNVFGENQSTKVTVAKEKAKTEFSEAEIDKAIAQMSKYTTLTDEDIAEMRNSIQKSGNIQSGKVSVSKNDNIVPILSKSFRTFQGGDLFRIDVPDNWIQETPSSMTVIFTPPNGKAGNKIVRGVAIEVNQNSWDSLETAMNSLVKVAIQKEPGLQIQEKSAGMLGKYPSIGIKLTGPNKDDKRLDSIVFYGILLRNQKFLYVTLFYPDAEKSNFEQTFKKVLASLQFSD